MDLQQFRRMLEQVAATPSADGSTGQRWDAARWCNVVARGVAERMDSYARLPKSMRLDTATGLFEHQLRHVMAGDYDRPYPGLLARTLMPAATGIPAGAETVVQRGFDITGRPELVVSDARDIPRVSLQATQSTIRVAGLAIKWGINYDEMLAAAMAQVDLDGKGLAAARMVQEREIDLLLSTGDAQYGIIGLANQATKAAGAAGVGVELYVAGVPALFTATWDTVATAAQILADLAILDAKFRTDNIYTPTDLALGPATYSRMNTLTVAAANNETILDVARKRFPGLRIFSWSRLATAGAAGGERAVMYYRDKMIAESIVSLEPTNLPVVWDGFGWETVCYSRCGGIQAADTTGIVYADM